MPERQIGERLKALRSELNKTQEEIAKSIGLSRAQYSHFENNRNEPDSSTLVKLANFYQVSTDYLLGNTVDRAGHAPTWATEKDKKDLRKFLKDNANSMTYGGEELTNDEKQQLRVAMETIFWKRHKHE